MDKFTEFLEKLASFEEQLSEKGKATKHLRGIYRPSADWQLLPECKSWMLLR